MYCLNDQHPQYEYTLFIQQGRGAPYLMNTYKSFWEINQAIKRIEKKHSYAYNRMFYIDNDFYDNECKITENGTYYKFMRRKVNDWEEFNTEKYERVVTQM